MGGGDETHLSSWWRTDRWRAGAILALLIVLPIGAFFAGRRVPTLEESVAAARPPEPTPIVAAVEWRVLETAEVFRGAVVGDVATIAPPTITGAVVTKVVIEPGDIVDEGDAVVDMDDRPVILLEGPLPLTRTLTPNSSGSLVKQLQVSLRRLGLYRAPLSGTYDTKTSDAVGALFERAGYRPPEAVGEEELAAAEDILDAAETSVRAASREYSAAKKSGGSTGGALDNLNLARKSQESAEESLRLANLLVGTPTPPANVVFVSAMPSTVLNTNVSVGDVVDEETEILSLNSGDPIVRVGLSQPDADLFVIGETVELRDDPASFSYQGTISSVEKVLESSPEAAAFDWIATIEPDVLLPSSVIGSSIQVVTGLRTSDGPTLVVPFTALRSLPDGTFYVVRLESNGEETRVAVAVQVNASGFVSITSTGDVTLSNGDKVVLGLIAIPSGFRDG